MEAVRVELEACRQRLRDVDHRIKNDLQLLASVFVLQARRLPPGPERDLLQGVLERISAVTAVQRRFDPLTDPRGMAVEDVVRDLVQDAVSGHARDDIQVRLDVGSVTVPARQAAPLALIVGELVRNAVRHAFPTGPGEVTIRLTEGDGAVELCVQDNGAGLAGGPGQADGFGTTLVRLLTQQLRGVFELADAHPGLRAVVRFPKAV